MPVKYSRLTPNQISTIIKLRNICKSYSFIAQEHNINKSSARRTFHKYNPKSKFSKHLSTNGIMLLEYLKQFNKHLEMEKEILKSSNYDNLFIHKFNKN